MTPASSTATESSPYALHKISWVTTIFLFATLLLSIVLIPWYAFTRGIGWFELILFVGMFYAGGLSVTVGYHRLFSHRAFEASWPVRLFVALFGAATFQQSALDWCSDHRYHHKYTDQDGDPHDPHSIKRGFFWAHMGWLIAYDANKRGRTNIPDLEADRILRFQDRHYFTTAVVMGFFFPMGIGVAWAALTGQALLEGLLAGFLFGAVGRIAFLHQATFLINSAAHMFGSRPYDGEASSRDNAFLAFFTFGEGYHNYHHAFQTDYRNGVKAWQWDPSKWTIYGLSLLGLATNLRRHPKETIRLAIAREKKRRLEKHLEDGRHSLNESLERWMHELEEHLEAAHLNVRKLMAEARRARAEKSDEARRRLRELKATLREARRDFRARLRAWELAHRQACLLV